MSMPIIIAVITITALASTIFVVIINYRFIKNGIDQLDFKNVVTQLVALTAWLTILSKTLLPLDSEHILQGLTIFVTSIVMGTLLIRNLSKELQTRARVSELIRKLQENNEQLKKLDKQKSEFVSLASHQLRGPLSVMQGYVSMILEGDYGKVPSEIKTTLEKVFQAGTNLGFLVNDYLDVSRLDKGEMEYVIQDFEITHLLEEITRGFRIIADRNNITITKEYSPNKQVYIRGDINKTRQILSNIIDNAIKYTPKGGITIGISINESKAKISIIDTGIGVEADKLKDIFGKFNRTKEAINLNVVGTGLGLYVAKIMTEGQDGRIWAESDGVGKGSRFYIELPLAA